jgi:hypothetical protein
MRLSRQCVALAREVIATRPSTPAVARPALRCVTCRTPSSVFDQLRNISFCNSRTLFRSPSCDALKILRRNRRTLSSWVRQTMASQSKGSSSGPFTPGAAPVLPDVAPFIVSNVFVGSRVSANPLQRLTRPTSAPLSGPGVRLVSGQLCGRPQEVSPDSRCPAAFRRAGVCLLGHPVPAGDLSVPHGRPTELVTEPGPRRGSHVPHAQAATGMGYAPGTAVFSRLVKCPQPPPAASRQPSPAPRGLHPIREAHLDEASSEVHLRSPVRSSPHRWPPDGAAGPWA